MSGVRSGVNGTPTFFINGVRHDELVRPRDAAGSPRTRQRLTPRETGRGRKVTPASPSLWNSRPTLEPSRQN